jgi:hypothetical protein
VAIYQNSKPHFLIINPIPVQLDGTFVVTVLIPSVVNPGAATIVACSYSGSPIQPPLIQCGVRRVLVLR